MWKITGKRRLAYCGRFVTDKAAGVTVMVSGAAGSTSARAGFSGLQTCGSVWACPVCAEKVNAQRQADIEAGLDAWLGAGNSVLFGTFTLRHNKGQSLAELWGAVSPAWEAVTSRSSGWRGSKSSPGDVGTFGIEGVVRTVEVKVGANGWHPHVHALFFIRGELNDDAVEQLRGRLFGRWSAKLGKLGFSTLEHDQDGQAVGVDLRRVKDSAYMADYFAKNGYQAAGTAASGAAYEVTGSQSKKLGDSSSRTPFEVLASLVLGEGEVVDRDLGVIVNRATGELMDEGSSSPERARDLALWAEWEKASSGRRQITWSTGLRDVLGLLVEVSDEDLAAAALLEGVEVARLTTDDWVAGRWAYRRDELLGWAESGELLVRLYEWAATRHDQDPGNSRSTVDTRDAA